MDNSLYVLVWALIIVGAFLAMVIPLIASAYLYYREKRLVFFKFISFKPEVGVSKLETVLIRICMLSEGISKVCFFIVLAIVFINFIG